MKPGAPPAPGFFIARKKNAAPTPDAPLTPTPSTFDVQTRTTGLLNPDGIFAVVPNAATTTVLYLQKQLGADTSFPAEQQCSGAKANHDITHAIVSINPLLGQPVVGAPQGWFASRVYSPSATYFQGPSITLMSAGYHEVKTKHALGDYRSIGFVPLYASRILPPF